MKYLANPDASTLAILGCGLQGRSHLEVIKSVLPKLSKVKAFDIRRDVAEMFARELSVRHDVEIAVADDPKEAVLGSEVVISGGPILTPPKPVIEASWLMEGVTGVTIDYDFYWTEDAMRAMDLIITDDRGQIAHLNEYGLFLGLRASSTASLATSPWKSNFRAASRATTRYVASTSASPSRISSLR